MRKAIKKIIAVALAVLLLVPVLSISAYADAPQDVLDAMEGVVCVAGWTVDDDGTLTRVWGTGFVINNEKENVIVTNLHIIEGAIIAKSSAGIEPEIDVYVGSNTPIPASVLSYSDKDLAFITIPGSVSLEALNLRTDEVNQGETVYSVGFPFTSDLMSNTSAFTYEDASITEGIISRKTEFTTSYGGLVSIIQHSATVNSGNSGGPLLDASGNVVGVNTWSVDVSSGGQGTFGAVSAWDLADFADDTSVSYTLVGKTVATEAPTAEPAATSAPAQTAAPTVQPQAQSSAALPVWVWALIGVLAVALVVLVVILIVKKSRKRPDPPQPVSRKPIGQNGYHEAGDSDIGITGSKTPAYRGTGGGRTENGGIVGGGMSKGSAGRSAEKPGTAAASSGKSASDRGGLSAPDDL